jgi:hypothetical protein
MFGEIRQTLYSITTESCLEKVGAWTTIFVGTDDTKILVLFSEAAFIFKLPFAA